MPSRLLVHAIKTNNTMPLSTELLIAKKYLQAKKKEAMISVTAMLSLFGIMLGVAALVVVISVMNGYRVELTKKLKGFNSDIVISNRIGTEAIKKYDAIATEIYSLNDVKEVFPLIESQALIANKKKSVGVIVRAIENKKIPSYPILRDVERNPKQIHKENGILLGASLAFNLGIRPGDQVKLISPEFTTTILGVIPNTKDFYVEGVFRSGLSEYDGVYAIIPLKIGQTFFNLKGTVNKLEVFTEDTQNIYAITNQVHDLLGPGYSVRNWQSLNRTLFNALKTEQTVMFIILTFIIIVAAFNIISSLTMLVTDKTKEISILRTIGFTRGAIMRIFLFCGAMLGTIGTLLGVGLGLILASNINEIKNFLSSISGTNLFDPIIYYLEVLPSKVDINDVIVIAAISLIVSLLANCPI